jgi:hypothetical protein
MSDISYQQAGRAFHQTVTPAAQAATSAAGLPDAPAWAGYWTWVTAVILLMFVLYTAQKGTLSTWLGFFTWSTQATPTATDPLTSLANGLNSIFTAAQNAGTATRNAIGLGGPATSTAPTPGATSSGTPTGGS